MDAASMNSRQRSISVGFFVSGILICLFLFASQTQPALAQDPHPTPTYDPLAQPELPPNPTDLEMGRYLFWRHCMPCHGDVGQGLTDEFRVLWEEHANCWDRGCHGGKRDDEGFPIPTVVPPIVTEDHLWRFTSERELFAYLKATHPPQYPGHLEDEEYHDIALTLLTMNDRPLDEVIAVPSPAVSSTPVPVASPSSLPQPADNASSADVVLVAGLVIAFLIIAAIWIRQKSSRR